MDTLMMIQILMVMFLVGVTAFFAGQIWESGRREREAKKEAIRRLTNEIMQENK